MRFFVCYYVIGYGIVRLKLQLFFNSQVYYRDFEFSFPCNFKGVTNLFIIFSNSMKNQKQTIWGFFIM